MADGPWTNYQSQGSANQPPWQKYAKAPQAQQPQGYGDKVKAAGEAFDKAAGTGFNAVGNTIAGALDVGTHMATGVAGDVAGAATSVLTQNPQNGEAVRQRVSDIGAPTSESGKAAEAYVGALTAPVSRALNAVPDYLTKKGHPIVGQVARAAEDVAGGRKALEDRPVAEAGEAAPKTIAQEAATKARAAGYVLKPSESGGKVGKVAEGLAGSPKLSVEASLKNQKVTNRLAAEEIGLPKTTKITKAALADAKKPHNEVYKQMSELGDVTTDKTYKSDIANIGRTPGKSFQKATDPAIDKLKNDYAEDGFNSKDAVLKVRELRANSTKNIKAPNAPERNELGYAQRQVADAIEGQMERHATAVGKADLVKQFRASRQALAKIHTVESTLVGNTGDVSAQGLAKQLQRGAPLSGKLKTIADTAQEFQEVTRDATKLKNKTPTGSIEGLSGLAAAGLGAMSHPIAGGLAVGGMVARPLVRKALLSDLYQDRLTPNTLKDAP